MIRQIATASSPQVARRRVTTQRLGEESGARARPAGDQEVQGWSRATIDALHHANFELSGANLLRPSTSEDRVRLIDGRPRGSGRRPELTCVTSSHGDDGQVSQWEHMKSGSK
ncbi:hypothetical protein ABZV61_09870 [Streptomyces sp900116325]|uniref:Uncharacterized protein n=1 Tax=Streptomyces sp. 900116325 TaxID=3154295 RepID=A0ABV2U5I3_9ACTN